MAGSSREVQVSDKEEWVAGWACRERHFRQREGPGLTMGRGPVQAEGSGNHSLAKMRCVRGIEGKAERKATPQARPGCSFPSQGFPAPRADAPDTWVMSLYSKMPRPPGTLSSQSRQVLI